MADVSSNAPADVRLWVALDAHKLSIVAAVLAVGGEPEVQRIETTERAVRRLIDRLGGPEGLAVSYEAGPGFAESFEGGSSATRPPIQRDGSEGVREPVEAMIVA